MVKEQTDERKKTLEASRMSFGDHLDELRSRMLKSIYGLLIGFGICLYFGDELFIFLAQPLLMALQAAGMEPQLYVASLPESFMTYIKVSLYCGIFASSPWIFYQLWVFIAAGLYPHERKYVHVFMPFSAVLFLLGGAFFIWVVAPLSCSFFIRFGTKIMAPEVQQNFIYRTINKFTEGSGEEEAPAVEDEAQEEQVEKPLIKPWFTLQKYVSLMIVLALAFGVAFQMPLGVFFLGRMSLVRLKGLKSARKYVLFGIVVFSALITPPDVISQLALSGPMYVLYELGILMLRLWPTR